MTPLVPLWIVFALLLALAILCVRAARIERSEGLTPSTKRLAVAAIAALVAGGIAAYATMLSAEPPPAGKVSDDPKLVVARKALAEKEAQLAQLRKDEEELHREVDGLSKDLGTSPVATRADLEKKRDDQRLLVLEIALFVMVLGFGAMLFLGDPRTLWLKRKTQAAGDRSIDPLDAMARAVHDGRFEEALRAAATVEEGKLEGLELIDFLFLRGVAAIQLASTEGAATALPKPKKDVLEEAARDLARVASLAPNMVEVHYALGTAHFGLGANAEAAAAFARAGELARDDSGPALPIAKARSACLVRLGERRLAEADAEGARKCFDEVMSLGVFTKEIPAALMSHRLATVLGDLRAGKLDEARKGIDLVREAKSKEGLDAERARIAEITCTVYEMVLFHRLGDDADGHARILTALPARLEQWQPKDLPEPEEQAADEYLFAAIDVAKLEPPPEVFRALYFLTAVAEVRVLAKRGAQALTNDDLLRIQRPLFRALQFEPRHRETLAALGVLYYLCKPDSREKALEWLDAAIAMGSTSKVARRLLDMDRSREAERTALLSYFRGTAARFLGDAMVDPKIRAALLEELGRFQDFRPVLVDLEHQAEIGHEPPTIDALRERVVYVQSVAANVEGKMPADSTRALQALRDEFDALVTTIEHGAARVSDLERRVMEEVGRIVLR